MILWQKDCEACKAKDRIISFLEGQINHLRMERNNERAEYKRAMDALLIKNNLIPIGQVEGLVSKQPSLNDIASIFEEIPEKDSNA